MTELRRPKVPEFDPAMKGEWCGARRRPDDPGTANRKPPGRGYANESEPMSHEQRLLEMLRGSVVV